MTTKPVNNQVVSSFPELMTESELAEFLRVSKVSKATNTHNVIDNLRRMHGLPAIHISRQPLYWLPAVREWIADQIKKENGK